MNMDKFLHNSFFNYIRALNGTETFGSKKSRFSDLFPIAIGAVILLSASSAISSSSGFFGIAQFYAIILILGVSRRVKPSMLSLAPISYKKRTVYSYITDVLAYICALIFEFLIILAIILFVAVLVAINTGVWIFTITDEVEELVAMPTARGQLFFFFSYLITYGAGVSISYIIDKKLRITLTILFPVLKLIFMLIIENLLHPYYYSAWLDGELLYNIQNIPYSWVLVGVFGTVATVVFGLSIYIAIIHERPAKF